MASCSRAPEDLWIYNKEDARSVHAENVQRATEQRVIIIGAGECSSLVV